jgi:hypothetical protein
MTILTPERAMQAIQQTPPILKAVIGSMSADQAQQHRDGAEGWSITAVVCHMRDYEGIVQQRIRMMLAQSVPDLPALDNEAAAQMGDYAAQDVHEALDQFGGARFLTYQMLFPLPETLWQRRGVHPQYGEISVIEVVINAALHDMAHIEQITRALAGQ